MFRFFGFFSLGFYSDLHDVSWLLILSPLNMNHDVLFFYLSVAVFRSSSGSQTIWSLSENNTVLKLFVARWAQRIFDTIVWRHMSVWWRIWYRSHWRDMDSVIATSEQHLVAFFNTPFMAKYSSDSSIAIERRFRRTPVVLLTVKPCQWRYLEKYLPEIWLLLRKYAKNTANNSNIDAERSYFK